MNTVAALRNLLKKLDDDEIASLKRLLVPDRLGTRENKSLKVLDILLEKETFSSADIQQYIYGGENYHAFNKILNRLRSKALDTLLLEGNLTSDKYSKRNQAIFEVQKKMLQLEILLVKGYRENLENNFDTIIRKCYQYEIYDTLVHALYGKRRIIALYNKSQHIDALTEEIEVAERNWKVMNKAGALFFETANLMSISTDTYQYEKKLEDTLQYLKEQFELTGLKNVGYFYYLLSADKNQTSKSYVESQANLESLVLLLKSSPAIFTENRLGIALLNLAGNKFYTRDYKGIDELFAASRANFMNQPLNLDIVDEDEFYYLMYSGRYNDALHLISRLFGNTSSSPDSYAKSNRRYLYACSLFAVEQFQEALQLIFNSPDIEKDNEGLNLFRRILTMLCLIELGDSDSLESQIANTDKYIKRNKQHRHLWERGILISKIISKLYYSDFDFIKTKDLMKQELDSLSQADGPLAWKVKSPELLVFHDWFLKKYQKARRSD